MKILTREDIKRMANNKAYTTVGGGSPSGGGGGGGGSVDYAANAGHADTADEATQAGSASVADKLAENSADYTKFLEMWARWDNDGGSKTSFDSWVRYFAGLCPTED